MRERTEQTEGQGDKIRGAKRRQKRKTSKFKLKGREKEGEEKA